MIPLIVCIKNETNVHTNICIRVYSVLILSTPFNFHLAPLQLSLSLSVSFHPYLPLTLPICGDTINLIYRCKSSGFISQIRLCVCFRATRRLFMFWKIPLGENISIYCIEPRKTKYTQFFHIEMPVNTPDNQYSKGGGVLSPERQG